MKNFYPEVHINKEVSLFLANWKDIAIESSRPHEPVPPEEPVKIHFPIFEIIGLLLFVLLMINFVNGFIYFALGFLFCSLVLYSNIINRRKYPALFKKYEINLKAYLNNKESYSKSIQEFEVNITSMEFLNSLKRQKIIDLIKDARPANSDFSNPIVGKSEEKFLLYLRKWFGNTIKQNRVIEVFNYNKKIYVSELDLSFTKEVENAYVPDFYFKHPIFNLNIDIEVDEPYLLKSLQPIHNIGNSFDAKRNDYFVAKKWFVIRFSEEQILLYPDSCCKEIAELIYDFTGDEQFINKTISFPRLERFPKWDYKESIAFTELRKRNNYQTLINKNEVFIENLYSDWDNTKSRIILREDTVSFITKQTSDVKHWLKREGVFNLIKDKFERHLLSITSVKGQTEEFLIDRLTVGELILTNVHTRKIDTYTSTLEIDYTIGTYSINSIKKKLDIKILKMVRQFDFNGTKTEWLSHWEQDRRIRVTMHETVMEKIKANLEINSLMLSKEIVAKNGEREQYIRYIISDKVNR